MYLLVRSQVLGLFVNTLIDCHNRENFPKPIQMQLPKKVEGSIYNFSIAFLELTSNVEHFEKKDRPQSLRFLEIIEFEKRVYLNV